MSRQVPHFAEPNWSGIFCHLLPQRPDLYKDYTQTVSSWKGQGRCLVWALLAADPGRGMGEGAASIPKPWLGRRCRSRFFPAAAKQLRHEKVGGYFQILKAEQPQSLEAKGVLLDILSL